MRTSLNLEINRRQLNDRELQILFLIANGKSNADVASLLYLSPNTIKAAVAVILKKLKVNNRAQAVYLVAENGYFKDNELLFNGFIN